MRQRMRIGRDEGLCDATAWYEGKIACCSTAADHRSWMIVSWLHIPVRRRWGLMPMRRFHRRSRGCMPVRFSCWRSRRPLTP